MIKHLLATCVVVLTMGCAQPMRVLIIGDFLGSHSFLHNEGRNGILWAITDINSPDHIMYHQLNVHALSAENIRQEIVAYRPSIILGPFDSATGAIIIPIANELGIPIIAPTISSPQWTGQRDYMTRLVPENLQEIQSMLYLMEREGVKRPLLIYSEDNEPYTRVWIDRFTNFFARDGFTYAIESYHPRTRQPGYLSMLVNKALRWRPDSVLLVTPGNEGGLITGRIRGRLPAIRFFVSGWTVDQHFLRWSGDCGDGVLSMQHFVVSATNPTYKSIYDRFVAHYRDEPSFGFVYGYEAMMLAWHLHQKSDGNLKKRWHDLFPLTFQGLQSVVFLDKHGDVNRKMFVLKVSNNQWTVQHER